MVYAPNVFGRLNTFRLTGNQNIAKHLHIQMDQWRLRRSPVFATHGAVASSQLCCLNSCSIYPLASEIGVSILRKGGNAADAAVGIAAALNVTQPMSTGIGGDMFCLFFDSKSKKVKGLNGSGRCPAGLSINFLESLGFSEANRPPKQSPLWITVPGAAAGWIDTVETFGSGKLTLQDILDPAITLAENGHPVNMCSAYFWKRAEPMLLEASKHGHELLIDGKAPTAGQIKPMPNLANCFRLLASEGKAGFYKGQVAEAIVQTVRELGGVITKEDLEAHSSTFVEPISTNYRGTKIFECPPNGQGITALVALNILEGFDIPALAFHSPEHVHLVIESLRLAFADTRHYVADPDFLKVPTQELLSKQYAAKRRDLISLNKAAIGIKHGYPERCSNTVYFCVVDGEGNACSFINSNYMGFGTHIVPKGCGFTLQNRGDNFSLDKNHPNCLQPGKRPYHTIIPGMAMKDGELAFAFGVMGGFMQAQGHVQVVSNMVDFNLNPQQTLDAPRFRIADGTANGIIEIEEGISSDVGKKLREMGHAVTMECTISGYERAEEFGVGQIITRNPTTGVLCAGSDPRHDGQAIGF